MYDSGRSRSYHPGRRPLAVSYKGGTVFQSRSLFQSFWVRHCQGKGASAVVRSVAVVKSSGYFGQLRFKKDTAAMRSVCLAVLAMTLTLVRGQADLTRVPGTMGADVVEATLLQIRESCVFPSDSLFLRRAAYVMTKDGTDPNTYRAGFDGGIWQVNQTDFAMTKSSPAVSMYWAPIKAAFNIDWAGVQWSDLRKPLYSGIAAMLTLLRVSGGSIPRLQERQAAFWQNNFFPEDSRAAYDFLTQTQNLDSSCASNSLDMAFIVDSSTSLAPEDFERAKQFASDVTGQFRVSPNDVRVAFVTYSSGYRADFDFQRYTSTPDVQRAIMAVKKVEGGTDTHLALKYAADNLFTTQVPLGKRFSTFGGGTAGSRVSAARVVIIITDGKSVDKIDAEVSFCLIRLWGQSLSATLGVPDLSNVGRIVLSTAEDTEEGVGNQVDTQELNNLASSPSCTHVQELQQYSELDSLKTEIKELSCKALVSLDTGIYTYPCGQRNNFQVNPAAVRSIVVRPTSGTVRVYGSHVNAQPNDALKDFVTVATTTKAAVIYVTDATRPLYLSIQSDYTKPGECVTDYQIDVVPFNALNKGRPAFL
ncbi:collagen alpha-1(xiv) chain [Plakobranchus ocellatus]|uniref:Collagen alpha-1(Xiv) chain n=1 Tax=Plakobranchus ocellatus TaxID=259542 RepID=A0AAV3Z8F7_9GAST|nr:collagen alpha-1(xiv) chain [Plakobranchus ocellatus]